MNKTESSLVAAINSGNYDEANKALSKFTALKSTTDTQSNLYFEEVEALLKPDPIIEDDETSLVEEESSEKVADIKEEVVAPRVETRGLKAKSKSRKEVEDAFNNALEVAINYRDSNRRTSESRFALRLVRQLGFIQKRLMR